MGDGPALLITRPDIDGRIFARGFSAPGGLVRSPLLRIEAAGPLPGTDGYAGLIFTSRNGVRVWSAAGGRTDLPVWTVGEATAGLAREAGMRASCAGPDAETLVADLPQLGPAAPLLHLVGAVNRGDVAGRLSAVGLRTDAAILYRQVPQMLTRQAIALLDGDAPVVVPLFSPATAEHFARQHRGRAPLWLIALSPAVAEAAACLSCHGFVTVPEPTAEAMRRAVAAALEGRAGAQ